MLTVKRAAKEKRLRDVGRNRLTINIGDYIFHITPAEARDLYRQLGKLLGADRGCV